MYVGSVVGMGGGGGMAWGGVWWQYEGAEVGWGADRGGAGWWRVEVGMEVGTGVSEGGARPLW